MSSREYLHLSCSRLVVNKPVIWFVSAPKMVRIYLFTISHLRCESSDEIMAYADERLADEHWLKKYEAENDFYLVTRHHYKSTLYLIVLTYCFALITIKRLIP